MNYTRPSIGMRFVCVLMAALLALPLLSGCWDRHEVDEIGIVGAMGIDPGTKSRVLISLEMLNPGALTGGTGAIGAGSKVAAWVFHEEASTIANAMSNIQRRSPRSLSLGQVNSVIFGQALAKQGIGDYIDYLLRQGRVRRSVFISTCDTGSGLLQRPFIEPLPSRALEGLAQRAMKSGKTTRVTLNEIVFALEEPGIEPITMHTAGRRTDDVVIKKQGEDVKQTEPAVVLDEPITAEDEAPGEVPVDSPVLDPLKQAGTAEPLFPLTIHLGIGAFKGDRLVGFLDGIDARGYLWAVGKVKQADMEVPDPTDPSRTIGITVVRSSASTKPFLDESLPRMRLEVRVDCSVTQASMDFKTGGGKVVDRLESEVSDLIQEEIRESLRIVQQEFKSDIYGFGRRVWQARPKLWRQLEPTWNDEVFPKVPVEITVKTRIRGSGALLKQ